MEDKLDIARIGEYEAEKVEKVGERLRKRYFYAQRCHSEPLKAVKNPVNALDSSVALLQQNDNGKYEILPEIRRTTRFRKYDLVKGPTPITDHRSLKYLI